MRNYNQKPGHLWRFPYLVEFACKYTGAICLALCCGYLLLGLWPFNFVARNNAYLDGAGMHFKPMAIVPGENISLNHEFSIEMIVSVETEAIGNIQSFFSIYDGASPENIFAGRWRDELLVRFALMDLKGRRKFREIGARHALPVGVRRFIAIVCGKGVTSVFVDGKLAKSYPRVAPSLPLLHGKLIFGDSPDKIAAFTGTLFGFALFDQALSAPEVARHKLLWETGRAGDLSVKPELAGLYLFNHSQGRRVNDLSRFARMLEVPENYRILHHHVLQWE
jgi:hypothetical protein